MISLLALCANPEDGTSFYRGIGPLGRMKKDYCGLEVIMAKRAVWTEPALADVAFIQRGCSNQHLEFATLAKEWGLPVWADYDDDLFQVPEENPAYQMYSQPEVQHAAIEIIRLADVVTVTTDELKRKLSAWNKNVIVIPNAIDEKMLRYRAELPRRENFTILWRGGPTHRRDIETVSPEIIDVVAASNATIFFQGYRPKRLQEALGPKCQAKGWIPFSSYFRFIHDVVRPNLTIVPLEDTAFNRSKSNIAWIESCFAGAPALAPDWEEWHRPGVITYSSPADFKEKLNWAIQNPDECRKQAALGWEYIKTNLTLGAVNRRRMELLYGFIPPKASNPDEVNERQFLSSAARAAADRFWQPLPPPGP